MALLLLHRGNSALAEKILDQATWEGGSSLKEPAHFLRCSIKADLGERKAARQCYESFLERYSTSPHRDRARQALKKLGNKR